MNKILHISAECYPAAKVGGLADVAGALPKYLNRLGQQSSVIIPRYDTPWIRAQKTRILFEGATPSGPDQYHFTIEEVTESDLGFPLYLVGIPGLFDKEGIYSDPATGEPFPDEMVRFFSFQTAVLEWMMQMEERQMGRRPDLVHCHDHHTALIPFMLTRCYRYSKLRSLPTVVTIHNAEYQGIYGLEEHKRLPEFDPAVIGLLDWHGQLNSLAAGIKCAWRVTTVSQGYLKELMEHSHGLEHLLRSERQKARGITNGIDLEVWNPETDPHLRTNFTIRRRKSGKRENKKTLCSKLELDPGRPLFSFIGRLVREKGADLLPGLIERVSEEAPEISLVILGTGDARLHKVLERLAEKNRSQVAVRLEYNEGLAHRIYAGSDFLLMPSRVEPCGLNQMYAMRYGTVPVVRATGGLADTVVDIDHKEGYGITFQPANVAALLESVQRAVMFYGREKAFGENTKRLMELDFSWQTVAGQYEKLYKEL